MKPAIYLLPAALLLLAGCVTAPTGPSVMALPGSGKSFDQFRSDDIECRQYANMQMGGSDANQAAVDSGVRSAALVTLIGAAAGAAMGGHGSAGAGAGIGLLFGSMAGADAAQGSARMTQRSYDNAYIQCMYAKGEQVPVSNLAKRSRYQSTSRPVSEPAPYYAPPPPPDGYTR